MNKSSIYLITFLVLLSLGIQAMRLEPRNLINDFISDNHGICRPLTELLTVVSDNHQTMLNQFNQNLQQFNNRLKSVDNWITSLNTQVSKLNSNVVALEEQRQVVMKGLVIYVLSRHNKLQALARRYSGKYFLAPDSIALLFSTILIDGGVNGYNELQNHKRLVAEYNERSEESKEPFAEPRKIDVVKAAVLTTVKDCVKTAVAIGLQKGSVYMMENYGFDAYLADLARSKKLSKTLGFVLARGIAHCMVECLSKSS